MATENDVSTLPAALHFRAPQTSMSTRRALKNAISALAMCEAPSHVKNFEDIVQVALDDLHLMLGIVE